jgi:hypothetical protein
MSMAQLRSNAPDSEGLTLDDVTVFENARGAVVILKKTFETWVMIGKAVVRARDIADTRGGGKTFMRIIEQQGLGHVINKTTASTLLRIMERLPEVTRWHETLTVKEKIAWAAPTTILKRCPAFAQPRPDLDPSDKPPTKAEQDRMALAQALEEIEQLKQQLKKVDGSLFDLKRDSAEDIALVLANNISQAKFNNIVTAAKKHYSAKPRHAG